MAVKKAARDNIPVPLDSQGIAETSRTGERGQPIESFVELTRGLPLHGQVYEVIRDWIVTMTLTPGQALSEKDLSDRLSVSRTPVREALIRLSDDGFVDIFPQRGTFVSFIDVDKLDEAGFIRKAVEGAIARELADSLDDEDITALNAIISEQRRAAQSNDYEALESIDRRLHSTLPALAGKPAVWRIVKQAMYHLERALRLRKRESSNWTDTIAEHEALVQAIIGRDAEAAVRVIERHIERNLVEVRKVRETYPEYFGTARRSARVRPELVK
ncbi:MAG TPA: GntR family transcriptional regulator [Pararobbsia sp.]|nr:GntR family transcriptional regulator [Pararobbsia sp.]